MKISKEKVEELLNEKLNELGAFLVELNYSPEPRFSILVDHPEGLSLDKYVEISRHIEHSFDREEEDFALEVSSPGLTEPFKVIEQYQKNIGREVEVEPLAGPKVKGTLLKVEDNLVTIETKTKQRIEGRKKKETIIAERLFSIVPSENENIEEIKSTKVVISFK